MCQPFSHAKYYSQCECVYILQSIHVDECFDCFCILDIMDNALMNKEVQVPFIAGFFPLDVPGRRLLDPTVSPSLFNNHSFPW